jgi:ABC-type glycerol-3-phosphate transport system substrate-binding protein
MTNTIGRRRLLGGIGGIATAGSLARPYASRAQAIRELVVLTGTTPWLPAYQRTVSQYEREKGIRITLRPFPYGGMRTQMVNAIQAKNPVFDVYQLDEPWTGQFYDNGWVKPLSDLDPAFRPDAEMIGYDSLPYWDAQRRAHTPQGKLMGLPLNGNVGLFYYRKDIYERLGLQVPRTWDEALENGRRAQRAGAVQYGYVTRGQPTTGGQSVSYEFMPVLYSHGANWFVDEGRDWTPAVSSEAAVAAAATFRRLLELGPERPQTVGQADAIALMQGGRALQAHFVAAGAPQLEDPQRSANVGKFGYAVLPAGPIGRPAPTSGTWSICVPADQAEDRQRAAADFLKWMLQRPQQETFVRAGGIPTRSDVVDASAPSAMYLKPVMDSIPNIRRSVRYVFSQPMLDAVEASLGQIGAGEVAPAAGLGRLQTRLTEIVREAGFLR